MRRCATLLVATVLLMLGALVASTTAFADVGGTGSPPAGGSGAGTGGGSASGGSSGSGTATSGSSSSGSDGGAVQGTEKSCSLYATANNFGLSCLGGGDGQAKTVKQILGRTPAPTCWDTAVSDADLTQKYQYQPNPDAPYYVQSCISGLDLNSSLYHQPALNLSQKLVEIRKDAPECKRPFTAAQKSGDDLSCVMTLVGPQTQVTQYLATNDAQIPGIVLATYPSTVVRTNVDTAYVDKARCDGCESPTRTANHSAGGVTLYAEMTSFKIEPYGPDGRDQKSCDGTVTIKSGDTRATKPQACWYRYTHSSADQPGKTYPFRAEATWQVRIVGQDAPFATFHKYSDIDLPVVDVQTAVIPGS